MDWVISLISVISTAVIAIYSLRITSKTSKELKAMEIQNEKDLFVKNIKIPLYAKLIEKSEIFKKAGFLTFAEITEYLALFTQARLLIINEAQEKMELFNKNLREYQAKTRIIEKGLADEITVKSLKEQISDIDTKIQTVLPAIHDILKNDVKLG